MLLPLLARQAQAAIPRITLLPPCAAAWPASSLVAAPALAPSQYNSNATHSSPQCSPFPSPSSLQQHSQLSTTSEAAATPSQTFRQRRLIGWTPDQVYSVVSDVDNYHKFVPWCIASRVVKKNKEGNHLEAELEVGFQLLREKYISVVTLRRPTEVSSTVQNSALFHRLDSTWALDPGMVPRSCWITFHVEFAFQRATYNHVVSLFFSEVTRRMMSAFEGRCEELYGPSALVRNIRPPLRPRDRGYHSQGEQTCHQRHQHQHQELCTSSKQQGMARRG